jgi:hypothetical protein
VSLFLSFTLIMIPYYGVMVYDIRDHRGIRDGSGANDSPAMLILISGCLTCKSSRYSRSPRIGYSRDTVHVRIPLPDTILEIKDQEWNRGIGTEDYGLWDMILVLILMDSIGYNLVIDIS